MKRFALFITLLSIVGCAVDVEPKSASDSTLVDADLDDISPTPDLSDDAGADMSADTTLDLGDVEASGEIGTMLAPFTVLEDGDPIELVTGFQGGWHLEVGFELRGADVTLDYLRDAEFSATVEHLASAEEIAFVTLILYEGYWTAIDGGWSLFVPQLITSAMEYPTTWIDGEVRVTLMVTLRNGQTVQDSVDLTLVDEVEEIPGG